MKDDRKFGMPSRREGVSGEVVQCTILRYLLFVYLENGEWNNKCILEWKGF